VPTLLSLKDGNGAIKLETAKFEVEIPKVISSVISMVTSPTEPEVLTEVIFMPVVFGMVFPDNEAL